MVSSQRIFLPIISVRKLKPESAVTWEMESRNVPGNISRAHYKSFKYSIPSIPTCTPGGRNYNARHFVGGHSETRCSVQGHAVSAAELGPHPGRLTPKSGLPLIVSRGFCAARPWVPPKPQPLA